MSLELDQTLRGASRLSDQTLRWELAGFGLTLRSNSDALLLRIAEYLQGFALTSSASAKPAHTLEIEAYERDDLDLSALTKEWPREAGKRGRKDTYRDVPKGADSERLIYKVRTGMHFLQRPGSRIAAGPCLANDNQLINFINAQWMSALQQQGWLIGHASAVVREQRALAIAGLSGGGKSTLMLKLLAHGGQFMSNDRLFIRRQGSQVAAQGIAKWPRINPGTIVHDQQLQSLIPEAERHRFLALPVEQLRQLEQKYDAPIPQLYGEGRVCLNAPLGALVVLNWDACTTQATCLKPIEWSERYLPAMMKSSGPFYQRTDGRFWRPDDIPAKQSYLDVLRDVPVFELSGRIDFEAATELCLAQCWDTDLA